MSARERERERESERERARERERDKIKREREKGEEIISMRCIFCKCKNTVTVVHISGTS